MCIDNDRREKLIIPIEIWYFNLHFAIKVKSVLKNWNQFGKLIELP